MRILSDPVRNPFNDWLIENALYVAIGLAAVIAIIVVVLLLLNKKKKR